MLGYYDPDGRELTLDEWAELMARRVEDGGPESWWRRGIDDAVHVSTVWVGLDHSFWPGALPLYWETMIFGGDYDGEQWRYSSRAAALDDHELIVRTLRASDDQRSQRSGSAQLRRFQRVSAT